MDRRKFLKILPAMAALSTWTKAPRYAINPAWVSAPYEAELLFSASAITGLGSYSGIRWGLDPNPLRIPIYGTNE